MRSLTFAGAVFAITLSGSALANPIMVVNEAYVEQFPGTNHVQITRNYSMGATQSTTVTRDGSTVEVAFSSFSAPSRDLGSGHSSVDGLTGCDCSVPIGHHTYVIANNTVVLDVVDAAAAQGTVRSPSAACDTKCASSIVAPPPTGGSSSVSTSTPNTGGKTGLGGSGGSNTATDSTRTSMPITGGSTAVEATTTPGTGGATVLAIGGATTAASSTGATTNPGSTKGNDDTSGCAISRTTSGLVPISVLAVLGFLALRRRK